MRLPSNINTHVTLTILGLTLASVHVARAFPMPEGSLEPRLVDSDSWAVALGPRDDLTSEIYSPSVSELHARFYGPEFDLEARDVDEDGSYSPSEYDLHARFYDSAFDLEARYSDDLDTGENPHSSLVRRGPTGDSNSNGGGNGRNPSQNGPGRIETDPRLQFIGGRIPGQRGTGPRINPPVDPRLEFTGGRIPGERGKKPGSRAGTGVGAGR
ncbi:hypothetical protein K474DRAFT_1662507 [Panus rudis PR-1116 ss-1]|nr:hypothetical protein K474DRAFT_1662507 [Panus rudis PR-1116 ss-1]